MKEEKYPYFSEKELEAFIAQVEEEELYHAPLYLEEMVLKRAEQQKIRQGSKKKPAVKRSLFLYSMKITAAAAAAIVFLILVPITGGSEGMQTGQMQAQQMQRQPQGNSLLDSVNEKTSIFCSHIYETSSKILSREEN